MEYPLIIHGVEKGRLSVKREGLFTVFEGQCEKQAEPLLRLSVYGGGREGYLGLMQPWNGGLYLKRKLSRAQLAGFPERIEYAAPAGTAPAEKKEAAKPAKQESSLSESMGASGIIWFRRCDGSLVGHDGKSCIVALPAKLREASPRAVIREIEGQSYILFRY